MTLAGHRTVAARLRLTLEWMSIAEVVAPRGGDRLESVELPAHWRDWDVGLELPDDVSAAEWLHTALRPWAQDGIVVANFVPASHEAFARVLHPAGDGERTDLRWADLARPRGVQVGPETGFCEASGRRIEGGWSSADGIPSDGSLPAAQMAALGEVLAAFTATPDDCVFCFWVGSGSRGGRGHTTFDPTLSRAENDSCNRRSLARRCAGSRARTPPGRPPAQPRPLPLHRPARPAQRPFLLGGWEQSPSLWWPGDRAWFVATEIDGFSSYVGGSGRVSTPSSHTTPSRRSQ